jgi:hypothetical protein
MPMSSAAGPLAAVGAAPGLAGHGLSWYLPGWRAVLRRATHACCCPGRPAVIVIMPAAAGRPGPVELLFCSHHYRVNSEPLAAAGALAFDTCHGAPASPETLLAVEARG